MSRGPVAAIGVFDGLHTGHQKIINILVRRAQLLARRSLVITFEPHPLKVLRHKKYPPSLISLEHRLNLLKYYGVDMVMVLRFTQHLAKMKGREFISNILIKKIRVEELLAGSNFRLGSDRFKLKNSASPLRIRIIPAMRKDGVIVSSTVIRKLIMRGDLERAAVLLGKPVSILGTVVGGSQRGRDLGFPTANIDPHHEAMPPAGVYAVRAKVGDINRQRRLYKGILNIGFRPTFHGRPAAGAEPVIEVHILKLKESHIYGKAIEVEFVKRIREERHFKHPEILRKQIQKDLTLACKLLK